MILRAGKRQPLPSTDPRKSDYSLPPPFSWKCPTDRETEKPEKRKQPKKGRGRHAPQRRPAGGVTYHCPPHASGPSGWLASHTPVTGELCSCSVFAGFSRATLKDRKELGKSQENALGFDGLRGAYLHPVNGNVRCYHRLDACGVW